jgi:ribosomal protein S18 acetylase RimI-like enzyme
MKRTGVVSVRLRTPADDRAIAALARPSFGRYSQTPEQSVTSMMRAPSARTLVADAGGRVVGFAIVSFEALDRPYGPWLRPLLASLDAIAVHESAQGNGVGKALLAEIERVARASGAVSLTLRTAATNGRAQALFRGAGFQTTVSLQAFYRGGQTALAMMKLLAA